MFSGAIRGYHAEYAQTGTWLCTKSFGFAIPLCPLCHRYLPCDASLLFGAPARSSGHALCEKKGQLA